MRLIRLVNATFFAHHGVSAAEKQTGGRYEVDVEVKFDFEEAAQEDDLEETVCYEKVYQIVKEVVQANRFDLIERIAWRIASQVMELSVQIEYAEISVRKLNPPIAGTADYAEVVYRQVKT